MFCLYLSMPSGNDRNSSSFGKDFVVCSFVFLAAEGHWQVCCCLISNTIFHYRRTSEFFRSQWFHCLYQFTLLAFAHHFSFYICVFILQFLYFFLYGWCSVLFYQRNARCRYRSPPAMLEKEEQGICLRPTGNSASVSIPGGFLFYLCSGCCSSIFDLFLHKWFIGSWFFVPLYQG